MPPRRLRFLLAAAVASATAAGCSNIERAEVPMQSSRAARSFEINAPRILQGTIGSETVIVGYQPVIVRGYGLVVGLKGTGSRDIPPQLRQHMVQEMSRRGIGSNSYGYGDIKPEAMLDSPDTAVVVVEGVIPPGSVGRVTRRGVRFDGTGFDVRVYAEPRTGTTSLEGGRLYTTELRPGVLRTGSRQAAALAEAGGPIFLNPFADPDALESGAIRLTTGRIMDGGEVLEDIPIKLRLATPSHARAETIQNSINAQFPQEPGQADPTARGESDELVGITVPTSWRDRPDEFIDLLRHTTIRRSQPEAVATSIARLVKRDPTSGEAATWRWRALGPRCLPIIRELYEAPERVPRMAALRAGAHLDDPIATPHLIAMAEDPLADTRRQAVALLGKMQHDPRIDQALRKRLNDEDVDVRLVAYEGLVTRGDPGLARYDIDGKFELNVIDSDLPLVYITQVGRPRIVVFGDDLSLEQPILLDAWSGRLMIQDLSTHELEVYYRPDNGGERLIQKTSPRLEEFVQFLGRASTIERPEPGLDLSYSQTVGAMYQIWREKFLRADFKAEQDRILAAIRRQEEQALPEARPEFADPVNAGVPDDGFLPEPVGEPGDTASGAALRERPEFTSSPD